MSLTVILTLAVVSVLCALTFALRLISWATLLRFHWLADVVFTATLFIVFAGTLGGTLVASTGGLLFSLLLTVGRKLRDLPPLPKHP